MAPAPWLRHYPAHVPHSLAPYPDTTLFEVLSETARQHPDLPAIVFKGTTLTAGEWEKASDASLPP